MVQGSFGLADANGAALKVAHPNRRPNFLKAGRELSFGIELPVNRRRLE
jgi:hypothetical protein